MLKKITTLTLAMFLFMAFSNVLVAQSLWVKLSDETLKTLTAEAQTFNGQSAITEAEIKKYAELLPKVIEMKQEPEKFIALLNANKMDFIRFYYIGMKTNIAFLIHVEAEGWKENANKIPEVLKPSKEEMALAIKYMDEITKVATN